MELEVKAMSFGFEDGKLSIELDPNKDGQKMLSLTLDVAEMGDEILDAIKGWKSKKAE